MRLSDLKIFNVRSRLLVIVATAAVSSMWVATPASADQNTANAACEDTSISEYSTDGVKLSEGEISQLKRQVERLCDKNGPQSNSTQQDRYGHIGVVLSISPGVVNYHTTASSMKKGRRKL